MVLQGGEAYSETQDTARCVAPRRSLRKGAQLPTHYGIGMRAACASTLFVLLWPVLVGAEVGGADGPADGLPVYRQVIGQQAVHVVTHGETLGKIAQAFGMRTSLAARMNGLTDLNRLRVGQRLILSNRHIVPAVLADGLVINAGDLLLYWFKGGDLLGAFPVGVGRVAWETPPGRYRIVGRRRDPVWHVPPSIQREMREKGQPVKRVVPPGPDNPLGKYWLQLSLPGYGIHGTNAPRSVGRYTTHGCVRLRPEDIERLYREVPSDAAVSIVNVPIKLARADGGTILVEAHDGATPEAAAAFIERLEHSDMIGLLDMTLVRCVLRDAWGVAVDVSKGASNNGWCSGATPASR